MLYLQNNFPEVKIYNPLNKTQLCRAFKQVKPTTTLKVIIIKNRGKSSRRLLEASTFFKGFILSY